eukprot:1794342-Pleurochrysis_carterae.AAC.1
MQPSPASPSKLYRMETDPQDSPKRVSSASLKRQPLQPLADPESKVGQESSEEFAQIPKRERPATVGGRRVRAASSHSYRWNCLFLRLGRPACLSEKGRLSAFQCLDDARTNADQARAGVGFGPP